MEFKPHDYQQYATKFIEKHNVSAVFLSMGLGKTVITLTAINDLMFDSFEIHKALIIAPLRVARDTWPDEISKWDHLKDLKFSVAAGSEKERLTALKSKADVYIINRENVDWLMNKSGLPFDYDLVIIDELSSFKNRNSKRFKALMKVRPKIKRIVGLTGTPASNGLMDLWAQFRLLDMGERLGRFIGKYREAYFRPDRTNGYIVYSYSPLPGAKEKIYEKISDITISMKSADGVKMPKLISAEYKVKLSDSEREVYELMKKELVLQLNGGEVIASNAGALAGKLCQMANGAVYADDGSVMEIHNRKLDALEDMIESMNDRPLLIAYWFKHDAERISKRLNELKVNYAFLDSVKSISAWNEGKLSAALIHPASAGHGLNLQSGGSTIVWFGLTWSLELYQQTNARLWRQGQKSETVVIEHIVTEHTIDEQILKALEKKDKMQESLINAVKANLERRV